MKKLRIFGFIDYYRLQKYYIVIDTLIDCEKVIFIYSIEDCEGK